MFSVTINIMAKLSTHHDKYHIHKTLGIISIIHFVYRFIILFFPVSSSSCILFYINHLLLHLSSFQFVLPRQRIFSRPLIWEEFRIHNAIFATRNILPCIFPAITTSSAWCKILYVWLWMFLADKATQKTKEQGITTRKIPYPSGTLLKDIERQKSFYVSSQFHATILSITDPEYSFLCVFGIEIAAFAMTLCRKGYLSVLGWHRVYFLSLYSMYIVLSLKQIEPVIFMACMSSVIAKQVRIRTKLNKYMIWAIVIATNTPINVPNMVIRPVICYGAISSLYECRWCLFMNLKKNIKM